MSQTLKAALAVAALIGAYLIGSAVQWPLGGRHNDGTIRVTGSGSVKATPDQMILNLTSELKSDTSAAALNDVNAAISKVLAALEGLGVEKRDISTQQVSVQPDTTYSDKTGQRITGYIARQSLKVVIRDLPKSGEVISKVVAVGGDDLRVDSTQMRVSNKNAALDQAREKAMKAALAKAELYAKTGDRALGPVLKIAEEGASGTVSATSPYRDALDGTAGRTPVEPGEQTIKVQVTVVWRMR